MNLSDNYIYLKQFAYELRPIGTKIGMYILYDIYKNPVSSKSGINILTTYTEIWMKYNGVGKLDNYEEIEKEVASITLDFNDEG